MHNFIKTGTNLTAQRLQHWYNSYCAICFLYQYKSNYTILRTPVQIDIASLTADRLRVFADVSNGARYVVNIIGLVVAFSVNCSKWNPAALYKTKWIQWWFFFSFLRNDHYLNLSEMTVFVLPLSVEVFNVPNTWRWKEFFKLKPKLFGQVVVVGVHFKSRNILK